MAGWDARAERGFFPTAPFWEAGLDLAPAWAGVLTTSTFFPVAWMVDLRPALLSGTRPRGGSASLVGGPLGGLTEFRVGGRGAMDWLRAGTAFLVDALRVPRGASRNCCC